MAVTNYFTVAGQMIGYNDGGGRKDFLRDNLGSVTAEIDQTGSNRTFDGRYKPYGNLLWSTGTPGKFGWVGSWGYRSTGLLGSSHYVRSRHFNSVSGSWTTVDSYWPWQPSYVYTRGKSVRSIDPSGHGESLWDLMMRRYQGNPIWGLGGDIGVRGGTIGGARGSGAVRGNQGSNTCRITGTGASASVDPWGPPCNQPPHRINGVRVSYWATCGSNCGLDYLAPMCWDIIKGFEKDATLLDKITKYAQCAKDFFLLLFPEVEIPEILEKLEDLADAIRCFSDCLKEAPSLDKPAAWQFCSSGGTRPGESCEECCDRLAKLQPWNTDCHTCCENNSGPPSQSGAGQSVAK